MAASMYRSEFILVEINHMGVFPVEENAVHTIIVQPPKFVLMRGG